MRLETRLHGHLVGWLGNDDGGGFVFDYSDTWLADDKNPSLFPGIRLAHRITGPVVRAFFENILPEGQALEALTIVHQISRSNLIGLLGIVGAETAGALTLFPGTVNPMPVAHAKRQITREMLSAKINERATVPFSVWNGKVRQSIAGFQDKVAVYIESGNMYQVEGERLASTHILKPEPVNPLLTGMTSNEFFCMRLAMNIGVTAAMVDLIHVPEPVLVITRFDRRAHATGVDRLHIIDGCQAMGLPQSMKYERPFGIAVTEIRDGASLPKLFSQMEGEFSAAPIMDKQQMMRLCAFNVLIGNVDAHAKNFSFLMDRGRYVMAPAYDLVCGEILSDIQSIDRTLAMAIGDEFNGRNVSAYDWAVHCVRCDIPDAAIRLTLTRLLSQMEKVLAKTRSEALAAGANKDVVDKIVDYVMQQCIKQREELPKIKDLMLAARQDVQEPSEQVPTM